MPSQQQIIGELNTRLQSYYAAERVVLTNQAYTIRDRQYTRADLGVIRSTIDRLKQEIAQAERGGMRVRRILFHDD